MKITRTEELLTFVVRTKMSTFSRGITHEADHVTGCIFVTI